jgi:hypothetical protein
MSPGIVFFSFFLLFYRIPLLPLLPLYSRQPVLQKLLTSTDLNRVQKPAIMLRAVGGLWCSGAVEVTTLSFVILARLET